MPLVTQIGLAMIVRVKDGALDRLVLYLNRTGFDRVVVIQSEGLVDSLTARARRSLQLHGIEPTDWMDAADISLQSAVDQFSRFTSQVSTIVGLGGRQGERI